MWFNFAILSGIFYTAQGLWTRKVLKGQKDSWAFSFYFSLVGALISLPFFLHEPKIGSTALSWALVVFAGIFIVAQNYLTFKSLNYISASINGSINKFRLVWIFIFGTLILGEVFSPAKVAGTILTIIAGLIVVGGLKTKGNSRGFLLAFSATFFYGVVVLLYKYLFTDFNSQSLTFFIFLIPALINIFIMPNGIARIIKLARTDGPAVVAACALGSVANLAMNYALSVGEASRVNVMIEAFLVVTLVGENLVLKEKDNLSVKILAVLLSVVGAILLKL